MHPLSEQTILVTGATDGIGFETARELAARKATVLVHGRTLERAESACARLQSAEDAVNVRPVAAELASLNEVRRLAETVRTRHAPLHALVNNAGVFNPNRIEHDRRVSQDGHELMLAVNYLAPFVLTTELVELLRSSVPARVVNVSSVAHAWGEIDWDDMDLERGWSRGDAYAQSKLALTMWTVELAERLRDTGITVNAVHPGYINSKMTRLGLGGPALPVPVGAQPVVRLVSDPDLDGVTGCYFDREHRTQPAPQTRDAGARRQLWEVTERLVEQVVGAGAGGNH